MCCKDSLVRPWPGFLDGLYWGLCQFGPHSALLNGRIIIFKMTDKIKDLPRYK